MSSVLLHAGQTRSAATPSDADMTITLNFEARFLRRKRLVSDCGVAFMVDLAETVSLNAGDAFILDDGRQIIIHAAAEPVLEIRHDNLARIAWHIGNRHTPCEIKSDHLIICYDHVLEDLLIRLGADLVKSETPFNPEGGAYGVGRTHGHAH
ncbi:MAG: urease accessory protein UreE [Candidatus Puniceispirillum sp.]